VLRDTRALLLYPRPRASWRRPQQMVEYQFEYQFELVSCCATPERSKVSQRAQGQRRGGLDIRLAATPR
jgi:hypothetical protein